MKDIFDKNVIIAVVLLMVWWWAWQTFFVPPPPEPAKPDEQAEQVQEEVPPTPTESPVTEEAEPAQEIPAVSPPSAVESIGAFPVENILEEELVFDNDYFVAVVANRGGRIKSWKLKRYKQSIEEEADYYEMISPLLEYDLLPGEVGLRIGKAEALDMAMYRVEERTDNSVLLTGRLPGDGAVKIAKRLEFFPSTYTVKMNVVFENSSGAEIQGSFFTTLYETATGGKKRGFFGPPPNLKSQVAWVRKSLEKSSNLLKLKEEEYKGGVFWAGFDNNYFLGAAISSDPEKTSLFTSIPKEKIAASAMVYPPEVLEPGRSVSKEVSYYFGPKEMETLQQVGHDLDQSLDFGWFGAIANVLVVVLKFFHSFTHNWGVAIVIMTVLIRLLLYPLTRKSLQSMKDMQRLQPIIKELREKYKEDKQKLNEEMMKIYKEHKVNPMGGCLPMLLQLPIFIAFYRALYQSIELRHSAFFLWIKDLSAPDPYYVTPIIMGVTMWLSQKMTPTAGDPTQAKIMQFMPIFFVFLFLSFPSGLVLYWLINNVLQIIQQLWMQRGAQPAPIPVKKESSSPPPPQRKKKGKK